MMLSGVVTSSVKGKWLILPWILVNTVLNIFLIILSIFITKLFFSWRILILMFIVIVFFLDKFINSWTVIKVVVKQFNGKKSGLKSWRMISPDLTSDTVCLVSRTY